MTTSTLRRLASGAVLALVLGLLSGCATHPAGPISTKDLDVARDFRLFTVYWAGRSFDGVALTAADTQRDYDAVAGERVYYGNCDKQSSLVSTVGCELPLEIATVEYHQIDSRGNEGLGTRTNTSIRGVPAVIFDSGRSIQLYTAGLAIDIYADSAARALAAARAVVPMNRANDPHPDLLSPPRFSKDVDPGLLVIERQLGAARQAAAADARAAAAGSTGRRRAPTGTTAPQGTSPSTAGGTASPEGTTASTAGGASSPAATSAPPTPGATSPPTAGATSPPSKSG
ncbi:MAG TPA: hypothetical protein VG165_15885 [Solirubrobacteraceae bacterium]|jgi:hypothetical protein|nr:hypothetical protein [Solirubrobacteraceae bacterium]